MPASPAGGDPEADPRDAVFAAKYAGFTWEELIAARREQRRALSDLRGEILERHHVAGRYILQVPYELDEKGEVIHISTLPVYQEPVGEGNTFSKWYDVPAGQYWGVASLSREEYPEVYDLWAEVQWIERRIPKAIKEMRAR